MRAVAIGMCYPGEAARFCGSRAPSVTCLCDRGKTAYAAYGLGEGSLAQVMYGPEVVAAAVRAGLQGHTLAPAAAPDIWRALPGTFAIDSSGTIRAAHYARHAGDQPDLAAMLRALRAP